MRVESAKKARGYRRSGNHVTHVEPDIDFDDLLPPGAAGELVGVSATTIRLATRHGDLHAHWSGSSVFVDPNDVRDWARARGLILKAG